MSEEERRVIPREGVESNRTETSLRVTLTGPNAGGDPERGS